MPPTYYAVTDSPVGRLRLVGDDAGVAALDFLDGPAPTPAPEPAWQPSEPTFAETLRQLAAYFRGDLRVFTLPLAPRGTLFEQAVWRALGAIPYGTTISYAELARRIGRPRAVRAVGAANGRNPLPIVIPCHRVIGSDGRLTGYGGGLAVKAALLALEGGLHVRA